MNPVFPPEVVDSILSHCGRGELLNSRLVCKAWNEFCLKHLAKSNHTHNLPYSKLNDFVRFLRDTRSKPVLPLKLATLRDIPNLDDTVAVLESLLDTIGPFPIHELGFDGYTPHWEKILPFLKRIQNELRSLELPSQFFNDTQEMKVWAAGINFPKLKYIRITCEIETANKSEMEFYSSLLSKCPVLEVLDSYGSLATDSGDAEVLIPFKSLKAVCNSWFRSPRAFLNQIPSGGSSSDVKVKLETCRFEPLNCDMPTGFKEDLLEIFQRLAPGLRHLFHTVRYHENDPPISLIHFPMLSRLDLSQYIIRARFPSGVVPPLNLRAEHFPALTTLSVPIGRYLVAQPDSAPLTTVRDLILKAPRVAMNPYHYRTFFSHVFNACPNAKRLSVEGFLRPRASVLIKELLQCTEAAGIEELGFWNYTRDWVGEEFLRSSHPGRSPRQSDRAYTLINVWKIRLSQRKYSSDYSSLGDYYGAPISDFDLNFNSEACVLSSSDKSILHLGAMQSHFPNLKSLEFSRCMLGSDYHSSWAAARKIQSKYPNWEVDMISDDLDLFPVIFKGSYP